MGRVGRKPQGVKHVESLQGSQHAKQRLRVFLETLSGAKTVPQACEELGIHHTRFFEQREEWLQEALELLEPRLGGRPARELPPASLENQRLQARIAELQAQQEALVIQRELSQVLPHVVHVPVPGKKTT
jgi:hypothetical protein